MNLEKRKLIMSNFVMVPEVLQIIEKYKLGGAVAWVFYSNTAQCNPYHNSNHLLWHLYHCAIIHKYSEPKKKIPVELLLASLFHDVDHPGGHFGTSDNANILRSLNAFTVWCEIHKKDMPFDFDENKVIELIACTVYPYERKSLDFLEQCMRDADLMQNTNDTLLYNQVGLRKELDPCCCWDCFLKDSIDFLLNIEYETPYGKKIAKKSLDDSVNYLLKLKDLCDFYPDDEDEDEMDECDCN